LAFAGHNIDRGAAEHIGTQLMSGVIFMVSHLLAQGENQMVVEIQAGFTLIAVGVLGFLRAPRGGVSAPKSSRVIP